jgi:hypothetical protein
MYIAAEHAQFLDIDPTGANSRVIDEISHHVLVYLADCLKKGATDQELLCVWHHVTGELSCVLDNTAHIQRH